MADYASAAEASRTFDRFILIVKRRRWLIACVCLVAPVVSVAVSLSKPPVYRATAEVLLDRPNIASSLGSGSASTTDPERVTSTLEGLARLPLVARRVLLSAGLSNRHTLGDFLANSNVSSRKGTDLLRFTVTDPRPVVAKRLATAYARVFTQYRHLLDVQALEAARAGGRRRLARLAAEGKRDSKAYATLSATVQQVGSLQALETATSLVVQPAPDARRVGPDPVRIGFIALFLGFALAALLACVADALDTRIDSNDELERRMGRPVLAHLPLPRAAAADRRKLLPMLEDPSSLDAEAFRMLRTSFDFVNLRYSSRTILVTSFVEEEGKSFTTANLAVALCRAGRRVVMVDLDARRPSLDRVFGVTGSRGIVEVSVGDTSLSEALVTISSRPVTGSDAMPPATSGRDGATVVPLPTAGAGGSLRLLPLGRMRPASPGEFVGSDEVAGILEELKQGADIVLVDSPPLLPVSDALTLSGIVDALLLVSRSGVARRPMVNAVRRALDASGVAVLGIVVTGVSPQVVAGYSGVYETDSSSEGAAGSAVRAR